MRLLSMLAIIPVALTIRGKLPWWEEGSLKTEATVRGGVGVREAHGVAGLVLPRSTIRGNWHHIPTCTRWASHTSDYLCG